MRPTRASVLGFCFKWCRASVSGCSGCRFQVFRLLRASALDGSGFPVSVVSVFLCYGSVFRLEAVQGFGVRLFKVSGLWLIRD